MYTEILAEIVRELFDQPIMSNLARPHYVERLVGRGLGASWTHVGGNWSGWDLQNANFARIEVKQSAARQTWSDRPGRLGKRTKPIFDIRERSGYFADQGTRFVQTSGRPADLYVFAWHDVYEPSGSVDHRDPGQWIFLLVPELRLPSKRKSISLNSLKKLQAVEADFKHLSRRVDEQIALLPYLKSMSEGAVTPINSGPSTNVAVPAELNAASLR